MVAIESYRSSADAVSYDDAGERVRICGCCCRMRARCAAACIEAACVIVTIAFVVVFVQTRDFILLLPLIWLFGVHFCALAAALLRRSKLYSPLLYSSVSNNKKIVAAVDCF